MFKKYLLTVIFICFTPFLYASQYPWWFTLEIGKQHYRNGAYGDALMAFEDARRARLEYFSRMEANFIHFLSSHDVRRLGDSLEFIEWYVDERRDEEIAGILSELYHFYPKDALEGSVKRALEEIDRLKSYPEAEFWLGETFLVEGELVLAQRQFERALTDLTLFQTPDFDLEILYRITEIHRLRGDYMEMERLAKEIIEGRSVSGLARDSLWTSGEVSGMPNPMRAAMIRIIENDGIDRFLTIYRYNNTVTEKAHRLLGFYFYSRGRYDAALEHLMFAFLIQNTILLEEVIRREFDYTHTSLENLMLMIAFRPELLAFLEETEYFKTIYYFSSSLFANHRSGPAAQLWDFLIQSNRSGEWGARARRTGTPVIESIAIIP